jgi:hypothetical protein
MDSGRMVFLGYGKWVKAERIYAIERLPADKRGHGRRTLVYVDGIAEPIVASRTEGRILQDMGQERAMRDARTEEGEKPLF